jgi:hypothetical protein
MGGLFGRQTNSVQQEVYAGIQVSTSIYGGCIPYVAGRQRVPFNLLWYGNFVATPVSNGGGGKGGGNNGNGTYNYSAAWVAALAIGPIGGVNQIWHDKALETLTSENLTLSLGGSAPAVWSGYPAGTPTGQQLPYDHISYVASSSYNLGGSANMPNLTFEIDGVVQGFSIAHGMLDADPSAVIVDYLTDPVHGAGFGGTIATLTGATNTFQAYVMCMGMLTSPIENTQRQASDFLAELMQITNSDIVLSAGTLKVIPYADQPVSATTPDGSHWSYTPNLTPLYIFNDNNFCPADGDPPVKLTRKALSETFNMVNVEYLDRTNYYNAAPAGASDLNDIALYGPRVMSNLTFHQITNAQLAKTVAQLLMQASLYERNTYEFRLPFVYGVLDPMDYIEINESNLGLVNQVVRVLEVSDDDGNFVTIKAMEVPGVTRSTPQYNWNSSQGFAANYAASPGNVSAPAIFQMPPVPGAISRGITIGIAVCGTTANALWKGCDVWCSLDGGTTYAQVGQVGPYGPGRYGTLTANIASGPDPDTTDTLSVALVNTNLQLDTSATHAEADGAQTLLLVDTGGNAEVMAYGTGALVSAGNYNLTYLRRGLYGSNNTSHSSGALFARLDGAIFQLPVDPGYSGKTLYFKFTSFNTFGQAEQALSAVTAYSYLVPYALPVNGLAALIPNGSCAITGDTVYKAGTGSAAWDSYVNSFNYYQSASVFGTCTYSGQQTIGLALAAGAIYPGGGGYTSFYGFYINNTGTPTITVNDGPNGTIWTLAGSGIGDNFQVTYDGFTFRYYHNGTEVVTSQAEGLEVALWIAMYTPLGSFISVEATLGSIATPVQFLVGGASAVTVNDTNVMKVSGTTNYWDCAVWSINSYTGACHVQGKVTVPADNVMFGFATAPVPTAAHVSAGSVYAQGSYVLYANGLSGTWDIYESGTPVATNITGVAPALTDIGLVTFDGAGNVQYYVNGTLYRTVSGVTGLTFYAFATFYQVGAGLNTFQFGPTVIPGVADTPQLGTNAATDTALTNVTSFSVGAYLGYPAPAAGNTVASYTIPNYPFPVKVTLVTQGMVTYSSSGPLYGVSQYVYLSTGAAENEIAYNNLGPSSTFFLNARTVLNLAANAGAFTAYSILGKAQLSDTLTINNAQVYLEVVKR